MDASLNPRFICRRNASLWSLILALEYQITKDIILHKSLPVRSLNLNKKLELILTKCLEQRIWYQ